MASAYTSLFAHADLILNILVDNSHHRMMETDIYQRFPPADQFGFRSALHHLIEEGLIKPDPHPYYLLLGEGSMLQATGGYKHKFDQENVSEGIAEALSKLELSSAQSVIDTNQSIQRLNTQTGEFYTHQRNFNNIQKFFTIAILLMTAISAVVATCDYYKPTIPEKYIVVDTAIHNQKLRQLDSSMKSQTNKFESFQKEVRDSLKIE